MKFTVWANTQYFNRYTIIYEDGSVLSMSHNPDSPQGFCQRVFMGEKDKPKCSFDKDKNVISQYGKKISYDELPEACKRRIEFDMKEEEKVY